MTDLLERQKFIPLRLCLILGFYLLRYEFSGFEVCFVDSFPGFFGSEHFTVKKGARNLIKFSVLSDQTAIAVIENACKLYVAVVSSYLLIR